MHHHADLEPTHSPNPRPARRILIVGGVAGGASCAARLRRLDELAEIAIFDRGSYVAFANCGLPYYVGDVIADERTLMVASSQMFRERFNVEVHTNTDVVGIDRTARTISVRDLQTGHSRTERYDALVLSPGAAPIRPPLPGVRPTWCLRGTQHSGLTPYTFLDRRSPRQRRGHRRGRIYRIGDGRELGPSWTLSDRAGKAASGHAPTRS